MGESPFLAALSRASVGRLHRTVLTTASFLFFFDLADHNTFAFAAPAIRRAHLFSVQDVAFVTATSFAGMAVGAIVGGRLADTFGRRRGLLVSVLLFSTSSLVNALVSTTDLMAAAHFATGLGLGATTSIAITYLAEITLAGRRGRFQATALGTGLIGIPVVAFTACGLTAQHPGAWRVLFVFRALGSLLVPLLLPLPESPRWLLSRARGDEAADIVRRFVPGYDGTKPGTAP
jgi:putative MFS transporter